jgi:hypothetical protein
VAAFLANPEKQFFLSTTTLGLTLGHEQWNPTVVAPDKRPKSLEDVVKLGKLGIVPLNNVNNTKHSTSFMVVKNTQTSRLLLKDWWSSVDPLHAQGRAAQGKFVGELGEPLKIYRTAWAHEQRVRKQTDRKEG